MNLLVIGGTQFVGKHLTEALLAGGHSVTHFNRGQTNPEAFPGVETIQGDRNTDADRLAGRRWDAVFDVCGYLPKSMTPMLEVLKDSVDRYLFVSTISVYAADQGDDLREDSALAELKEDTGVVDGSTYGAYKVICENVVREAMGDRATIVRPGLIVGPGDHTQRFTYWPVAFSEGGPVMVPNGLDRRLTSLDVRDFAAFMRHLVEQGTSGTFNVDRAGKTFGDLIAACEEVTGASKVLVDEEWLVAQEVKPWAELPCWAPHPLGVPNVERAVAAGLTERPLASTVQDVIADAKALGLARPLKAGLASDKEKELLARWDATHSSP